MAELTITIRQLSALLQTVAESENRYITVAALRDTLAAAEKQDVPITADDLHATLKGLIRVVPPNQWVPDQTAPPQQPGHAPTVPVTAPYQPDPNLPNYQPRHNPPVYQPAPNLPGYQPDPNKPAVYQPDPNLPGYQPNPNAPGFAPLSGAGADPNRPAHQSSTYQPDPNKPNYQPDPNAPAPGQATTTTQPPRRTRP